ncbi:Uncharacterized protein TCM_015406 [Theobroma cacao]|uniref:Uncharacterized protein n=1 Tax=Theobroma cacao TaxID=3641 RepID=A0A061G2C1_THECC|nr:Uncharacterized protein TCM_015406 [Theobroma cacao]
MTWVVGAASIIFEKKVLMEWPILRLDVLLMGKLSPAIELRSKFAVSSIKEKRENKEQRFRSRDLITMV